VLTDEVKDVKLYCLTGTFHVFIGDDPQSPNGLSTVEVPANFELCIGDPLWSVWVKTDVADTSIMGVYI